MPEFAFDVKLFAVARIEATTKEAAIAAMKLVIDCADLSAVKFEDPNVRLTEVSLAPDDEEPFEVFEIDGEPVKC